MARKGQLSQAELAQRLGIGRTSLANMEAGKQTISLHVFVKWAYALGVSFDTTDLHKLCEDDAGHRGIDAKGVQSEDDRDAFVRLLVEKERQDASTKTESDPNCS